MPTETFANGRNPVAAQPSAAQPSVTPRSVTQPSVTQPSVTQPSAAQPSAAQPSRDRKGATTALQTIENRLERFANRKWLIIALAAATSLMARVLLLPLIPVPKPAVQDEFSYLLASDTFASGRLTNPTPPFPEHFETPNVILHPTYASKYPPFSALTMALAQKLLGEPWIGVWLSVGLMCATLMWALQGWLPPLWAMIGGLFAVLRIGVISYWSESYWGGSCAAIGGALVIGATPRFARQPRSSALAFAAGLAILANTRPFEGLILAIACLAYVVITGRRPASYKALIVPMAAILLPVAAWMAYYNFRVTGHPLRMPYVEHEQQYVVWSPLLWQAQPKPAPTYSSSSLRDFWTLADSGQKQFARDHLIKAHLSDLRQMGSFFLGWPLIVCAIVFVRPLWQDRTARSALFLAAVFYAGAAFDVRLFPHYVAPATALAYILAASTLRALRNAWPGGAKERLYVSWSLIASFALLAVLSMPRNRYLFGDIDYHRKAKHATVAEQLSKEPGQHLVLVKYGSHHDLYEELVYNRADLGQSKIIWARSLDPGQDRTLIHFYGDRKLWLLEEDGEVHLTAQDTKYYNPPTSGTIR